MCVGREGAGPPCTRTRLVQCHSTHTHTCTTTVQLCLQHLTQLCCTPLAQIEMFTRCMDPLERHYSACRRGGATAASNTLQEGRDWLWQDTGAPMAAVQGDGKDVCAALFRAGGRTRVTGVPPHSAERFLRLSTCSSLTRRTARWRAVVCAARWGRVNALKGLLIDAQTDEQENVLQLFTEAAILGRRTVARVLLRHLQHDEYISHAITVCMETGMSTEAVKCAEHVCRVYPSYSAQNKRVWVGISAVTVCPHSGWAAAVRAASPQAPPATAFLGQWMRRCATPQQLLCAVKCGKEAGVNVVRACGDALASLQHMGDVRCVRVLCAHGMHPHVYERVLVKAAGTAGLPVVALLLRNMMRSAVDVQGVKSRGTACTLAQAALDNPDPSVTAAVVCALLPFMRDGQQPLTQWVPTRGRQWWRNVFAYIGASEVTAHIDMKTALKHALHMATALDDVCAVVAVTQFHHDTLGFPPRCPILPLGATRVMALRYSMPLPTCSASPLASECELQDTLPSLNNAEVPHVTLGGYAAHLLAGLGGGACKVRKAVRDHHFRRRKTLLFSRRALRVTV